MGFYEINHKVDMKVKKDSQVIISPLIQSMSGFRQAIFPAGGIFQTSDRGNRFNGRHGLYSDIPKRTNGSDTSL
jgi:hypothetical protein